MRNLALVGMALALMFVTACSSPAGSGGGSQMMSCSGCKKDVPADKCCKKDTMCDKCDKCSKK